MKINKLNQKNKKGIINKIKKIIYFNLANFIILFKENKMQNTYNVNIYF